jgi:polyisoprenoid-binding protein YceI
MISAGTWTIDPSHSNIEFSVKHMMITTVKGRFSGVTGTVVVPGSGADHGSVDVSIDAGTVDTRDEKRDEHLRSNDFFGAGDHPQITFRSTSITAKGDDLTIAGDLTIRGVTRPVVLEAEFEGEGVNPWGMTVAGASAKTKINRDDFGVTWNAGLETGGVLVSNDVKINLDLELVKQG